MRTLELTHEPTLFLIPVEIAEAPWEMLFPEFSRQIVDSLQYFAVENVRSARRFIRRAVPNKPIDPLVFFEIGKHSPYEKDFSPVLKPLLQGHSMGLLSEAGCPAVADPGSKVVALAQNQNIRVVPLVGPSSLLLALMASGLNGQRFAFKGYLPSTSAEQLKQSVRAMEKAILSERESQIFIETPYRNNKLFDALLSLCSAATRLCVAQDITGTTETIITRTIQEWKKSKLELMRVPTIFILGA